MEINSSQRKPPFNSNKAELDKFSRRLIRAVSRMLLREKRDEEEVWEGLRRETGCDCKELWFRMRALTMKKLDRLLEVNDQVDLIPKSARMSITDWLLYDTVLVHQNFDVIGMTETSQEDRPVLVDLFDLVLKYKLEFKAGDELADAWAAATIEYNNKNNRQCTPMLLQRRWYQLKMVTRVRFYDFWYRFKSAAKKVVDYDLYIPTPLQTNIAKNFKHLVVSAFSTWDVMIKQQLVILREEFAAKETQSENIMNVNEPDVVCVEPKVETIDLENESDLELDYRKPQQKQDDLANIKIKEEPKDEYDGETVPYQNRLDKLSYFAEAVMEATTLELHEMDLAENGGNIENAEESAEVIEINADDKAIELSDEVVEVNQPENSNITTISNEENITHFAENISENIIQDGTLEPTVNNDDEMVIVKTEIDIEIMDETTKVPEQMLPQITNIFGGINDSNEALSTISKLAHIAKPINMINTDINKCPNENIIEDVNETELDEVANVFKPIDIKKETDRSLWFGELSNNIDFVDDGIQLIDDGIALEDDVNQNGGKKNENEFDENIVVETEDSEYIKFDKKLLMVPVVYTVKLDDMGILPIHLLQHVDDKWLIDVISSKSKVKTPEIDTKSESDEENVTENINKVKLSSYLLQKPRNRTYDPIKLCKNPDFNTRLKRLNVGFFSSCRNRLLLKACQPVTIDVSKAFEDRLVGGTIYLNLNEDNVTPIQIIPDSAENTSVLPSAMPVQSLIDNARGQITPVLYEPLTKKTVEDVSPVCQRNKTINLPDITEIRRINQNLLTAQVTPIQVNDGAGIAHMQVKTNNIVSNVHKRGNVAGPASRKRPPNVRQESRTSNSTLNIPSNTNAQPPRSSALLKRGHKIVMWKSREIRPEVPWYSNLAGLYAPDTLLALDSLNKMLNFLTGVNPITTYEGKPAKNKKKQIWRHNRKALSDDKNNIQNDKKTALNDDTGDVQIISDTVDSSKITNVKICEQKTVVKSNKRKKPTFCCWARDRISQLKYSRKRKSRHTCPFPLCLCCCKFDLLKYYKNTRGMLTDQETSDHTVKQKSDAIDSDADVAELIPIKKTDQSLTSNRNNTVSHNEDISTRAVIVPCGNIAASSDSINRSDELATEQLSYSEISPPNELENDALNLGAEVSIITDKSTNNESEVSIPIKSPRIRVKPSVYHRRNSKPRNRHENLQVSKEKTLSKEHVVNIIDNTSVAEVNDSFITSNTKPFKTKVDSKHSTVQCKISESSKAEQTLKDNKLYLCVEPLVRQANNDTVKKIHHTVNNERPHRGSNISKLTADKNKIDIYMNVSNTNTRKHSSESPTMKQLNTVVVTPRIDKGQKMIYLNSKQIAELPSNNPIHLGKNKILLTTLKFPRNFKAFESYQRNLRQTMALPKGVSLKLLLDGRLTFTRSSKAIISEEFLAAMPHLVQAIQQQIDSDSTSVTNNPNNEIIQPQPNNEIICLSDDESDISSIENSKNKTQFVDRHEIITADNVDLPEDQELSETSKESNKEVVNQIVSDEININNCENTVSEVSLELLKKPKTDITDVDVIENKCSENKTKNILSDLMAMSGILSTDETQESSSDIIHSNTTPITPDPMIPLSPIPQHKLPNDSAQPTPPIKTISSSIEDPDISLNFSGMSLTPITSLAELKYACMYNSSFYKLDFDTKLLVPINVCMKSINKKKIITPMNPTKRKVIVKRPWRQDALREGPTIDLTDDDAPVQMKSASQSLLGSNYPASSSDVSDADDGTTNKVKPMILFRARNLQEKLKNIQKGMIAKKIASRELSCRKRTQALINLDLGETSTTELPDSSSDEEPLANLAVKKRRNEVNKQDFVVDNIDLPMEEGIYVSDTSGDVVTDFVEENVGEIVDDKGKNTTDVGSETMDIQEDDMEYLDDELLNEEEYCILGV